ncbi:Enoyl-CoA hydratase/carnithine racemase [Sinosporangium album]|uniref:Enoyl-CoA hydratase/carnithine racemase n=1 Tax=Sinosporangium album TaxID=504805 RepID=A0A1G8FPB9_9ACTN|nr:enoyl-CoA hydratase/isomerase family protein [Sinosporangium album]SDH83944.1 Enoyl-CoA hydratase/carnithine racemase [Sinosporangium album]
MRFDEYHDRFQTMKMTRENGVLDVTLHTEGDSLIWSRIGNIEFPQAFRAIAGDPDNRVVIIRGTGELFSGPAPSDEGFYRRSAEEWSFRMRNGLALVEALLSIDTLVIACINGPVYHHPEIPLLADIVLSSPEGLFRDFHFPDSNMVPGDAVSIVFPLLMGLNRARHFLLTGEVLSAQQALDLGLVNELMPREDLLPRAQELAASFREKNPLVLRYTRHLFTRPLKKAVQDALDIGLALEGLAVLHESSREPSDTSGAGAADPGDRVL